MVTSSHLGQPSRTLQYLSKPIPMSSLDVDSLPSEAQGLILAGIPKSASDSDIQWMRKQDAKYAGALPSKYYFSAIAAFPLPVWPFYLVGELDLGRHLECYIAAYYPEVAVRYVPSTLTLDHGGRNLEVDLKFDSGICSSLQSENNVSVSCYIPCVGAISMAIKKQDAETYLEKRSADNFGQLEVRDLSPLQYEGPVRAMLLRGKSNVLEFSAHVYLDKQKADANHVIRSLEEVYRLTMATTAATGFMSLATWIREFYRNLVDGHLK